MAESLERVEDDPRLASLPETTASGLSQAEAARRRALGMGNDAVIRTGRTYSEIVRDSFGAAGGRIAGFLFLGTPGAELEERMRPERKEVVASWAPETP